MRHRALAIDGKNRYNKEKAGDFAGLFPKNLHRRRAPASAGRRRRFIMKHQNRAKGLRRLAAGSLAAVMTLSQAAATNFTDTAGHWAKTYIEELSQKGKIQGYEDGTFRPDAQVTNLETLVFSSRLCMESGAPVSQISSKWNARVKEIMKGGSDWAYQNLAVCLEAGIVSESELSQLVSSGKISKAATRQDLALYTARAMQLGPAAATLQSPSLTFRDADDVASQNRSAVYLLAKFKVVEGMENNEFQPKGPVTRAQVAAILSRAMDYMEGNGLEAEFADYTSYPFQAGTVVECQADGESYLLTLRDAKGETEKIRIPSKTPFYQDGAKISPSEAAAGGFARVRCQPGSSAAPESVTILSNPQANLGTVEKISANQIVVKDSSGENQTFIIDRFTQVLAGSQLGDRTAIDPEAGYRAASCTSDGMGRLLSLRLTGGGAEQTGLIVDVDGDSLLVNSVSGVISRYQIPDSAEILVNGAAASLSETHKGRWVSLRVSHDDGKVTSVDVDARSQYLQAVYDSAVSYEGANALRVTGVSDNRTATYRLAQGCRIVNQGKETTYQNVPKGSLLTMKLTDNRIAELYAETGDYTASGALAGLEFGETIVLEVKDDQGGVSIFSLNPNRLPAVRRDGKTSSIDRLTSADSLTVTVSAGKPTLIEAKTKSQAVSGKVERVSFDSSGNLLYLTDKNGETTPYTLASGVSVVSGSSKIDLSDAVGGSVTLTVVNGLVTEVKLTGGTPATGELLGSVLFVNVSDKVILLETDSARVDNRVSVSAPAGAKIMRVNGVSLTLDNIQPGDQLQVFGAYKGDEFIAAMILVK